MSDVESTKAPQKKRVATRRAKPKADKKGDTGAKNKNDPPSDLNKSKTAPSSEVSRASRFF